MHPNGFPSVCLILEHFLEEQYPEIYAQRRSSSIKQADCEYESVKNFYDFGAFILLQIFLIFISLSRIESRIMPRKLILF